MGGGVLVQYGTNNLSGQCLSISTACRSKIDRQGNPPRAGRLREGSETPQAQDTRKEEKLSKLSNQYVQSLSIYTGCPKAIFAALACSFARRIFGDDKTDAEIETELLNEWNTLYQGNIVPQKPKDV